MVTLIATDVQGSTELWEWNNKAMMEAINLHDRIMRSQITKFGGYETATEGDAFVVAFRNPGNAVAWAAAMQQVRCTLKWQVSADAASTVPYAAILATL